jgi:hypothetical protein
MAKIEHRQVNLTGLNLFCHYTHGVAATSLVSPDACPDNFYPVRRGRDGAWYAELANRFAGK